MVIGPSYVFIKKHLFIVFCLIAQSYIHLLLIDKTVLLVIYIMNIFSRAGLYIHFFHVAFDMKI